MPPMGGDSATTQRTRCRAMKRCAWCHGRLGLGVRSRNFWNGLWWLHVHFCSSHCEAFYEVQQCNARAGRWRTVLARLNPLSRLPGQLTQPGHLFGTVPDAPWTSHAGRSLQPRVALPRAARTRFNDKQIELVKNFSNGRQAGRSSPARSCKT